jgi:subtilisin family serine protease
VRTGLIAAAATAQTPGSTTLALDLVRLGPVMGRTAGSPDVAVGLVDGPVAVGHPDLAGADIRPASPLDAGACSRAGSAACAHGTFVAGILAARRGSGAPAICPACPIVVRPIFRETGPDGALPTATPDDVADAIVECVDAGARIVNLSAATGEPTTRIERTFRAAVDHVAQRGALVVAAAGNQGTLGSSAITRHPGVIPVVAYDVDGRPLAQSNFGLSAGRWGIGAPGDGIVSLGTTGVEGPRAGTSFAAAFVTGALALLWSLAPEAGAARLRRALLFNGRRRTVIPPLMDASAAYALLTGSDGRA